ncbi:MAG: hypothetical protein JOZ54_13595 [Acidobacteria bacterium]|nr:hypothetical protein [Acidobacteriota bacterium]
MPLYPPSNLATLWDSWFPNPATAASKTAFVLVADIGQGNLNAIFNELLQPFLYFDLGGGFGTHLFTFPNPPRHVCQAVTPKVILSNWDTDHLDTAFLEVNGNNILHDTHWLGREWVHPRQYNTAAVSLQQQLVLNGRDLHLVANGAPAFVTRTGLRLYRLNGNSSNNVALALRIENPSAINQFILLPADGSLNEFAHGCDLQCVGMTAVHHGAEIYTRDHTLMQQAALQGHIPQPLLLPANTARTFVYSYGAGNSYGHPATNSVAPYSARGWGDDVRFDTAGAEADAPVGGPRGNVGIVWPQYRRGPGTVAPNASADAVQRANLALIHTALAEITLAGLAGVAGIEHVAVAAAYEAARIVGYQGSSRMAQAMTRDGAGGALYAWPWNGTEWSGRDGAQAWPPVKALAASPANAATLFAGTAEGLAATADGGATWTPVAALAGRDIRGIATSANGQGVLVATDGGLYASADGGANWFGPVGAVANPDVRAVAVDPTDAQRVYAATAGGLHASFNGGAAWNIILNDNGIRTVTAYGQTVHVGTGAGVFATADGGTNWGNVTNDLGNTDVRVLVRSHGNPLHLFAATPAGVFDTANGGGNWNAASNGLTNTDVRALVMDPASAQVLYAATPDGVFRSSDAAANWGPAKPLRGARVHSVASDPALATKLLAATSDGVWISTDKGETWTTQPLANVDVRQVKGDAGNANRFWAATAAGVSWSTDGGTTWNARNTNLPNDVRAVTISPASSQILAAATGNGFYRTPDTGANWQPRNTGLGSNDIRAVLFSHASPQHLFVATAAGVFRTANSGMAWNAATGGLPNDVRALVMDPATATTLYAATNAGVYGTTDSGNNWNLLNNGLGNLDVRSLAIDPSAPQRLLASTAGGVFETRDAGANWAAAATGLPANVRSVLLGSDPTWLAAATDDGVFVSSRGGSAWAASPPPLPRSVRALAVAADRALFAGVDMPTATQTAEQANGAPLAPGDLANAVGTAGATSQAAANVAVQQQATAIVDAVIQTAGSLARVVTSRVEHVNDTLMNTDIGPLSTEAALDGLDVYRAGNAIAGAKAHVVPEQATAVSVAATAINAAGAPTAGEATVSVAEAITFGSSKRSGCPASSTRGTARIDPVWLPEAAGQTATQLALTYRADYSAALASAAVLTPTAPIQPQSHPPNQFEVRGFAGAAGGVLYAAVSDDPGILFSEDGGNSWMPRGNGLTSFDCRAVAVSHANALDLYCATDVGVFTSNDGGANWLLSGLHLDVVFVAVSPANAADLVAATGNDIYASNDSGANWAHLATLAASVRRIVMTNNAQTLWAASSNGVYVSTDAGATWNPTAGQPANTDVKSIVLSHANPAHLFAGTAAGIFRTINGGANWNVALANVDAVALAMDPNAAATLYAATTKAVYKTTSSGAAWSPINFGLGIAPARTLNPDPAGGDALLYAAGMGGIYAGTQNTGGWTPLLSGLTTNDVRSVLVSHANAQDLWAATGAGVFRSTDGGANWVPGGAINNDVRTIVMHPGVATTLFAATAGGFHRSTDSGATWNPMNTGLGNLNVRKIIVSRANGLHLWAATAGGVFRTVNGGANWLAPAVQVGNVDVRDILQSVSTVATIWAATAGGVFRSVNGGANWAATLDPGRNDVRALDESADYLFAAADDGIHRTDDDGANWEHVDTDMDDTDVIDVAVVVNSATLTTVLALTAEKMFYMPHNGDEWYPVNREFAGLSVNALYCDPAVANMVLAGTDGSGIFLTRDGGGLWNPAVTRNAWALMLAHIGAVAAQIGVANGMNAADAAKAATAAARVILPAAYGAPQIGCHLFPSSCGAHLCALSMHYFSREA